LQKRPDEAGTIARVPAPDIETVVVKALREHLAQAEGGEGAPANDRDLIERLLSRVIVRPQAIDMHLVGTSVDQDAMEREGASSPSDKSVGPLTVITVPWAVTPSEVAKGILHSPSTKPQMKPETRDALLSAIAKARVWIDDLANGKAASFAEIAEREGKVERHVRFLAPLAFVSPKIAPAIVDGSAPADLTVTDLAKSLPCSWAEQERRLR
jgi:hypothetical protein